MSEIINKTGDLADDFNREPEVPEFIIETDDDQDAQKVTPAATTTMSKSKLWLKRLLKALAVMLIVALTLAAYKAWNYYCHIGVPVSTTPAENIEKLKRPAKQEKSQVVMTSDSILGVALDFYAIHGLRASIEFQEPDTADTSVFLYCRSADHQADGTYLGSLVVKGEEKQSDRSRLGYMGMVDNQMVIGVSRSDKVKDYCQENGGYFFRQFILVSNGVIPQRFFLHGKVERRAIGRKDDTLFYIATHNKETLWDFADALRYEEGKVRLSVTDQWESGISGYEVQYTPEGQNAWVTERFTEGTDFTLDLPKEGTYEIRVRAFVDVTDVPKDIYNSDIYYGDYSDVQTAGMRQ